MELDNLPPVIREQLPLNQALAAALIGTIPPDWRLARLRVAWSAADVPPTVQVAGVSEALPGAASDELRQAVENFSAFRAKYRLPFQAVLLEIRSTESAGWQMSLGFE